MSFLHSILTEKQLANFIFFGVAFGPVVASFAAAQIYMQAAEQKRRLAEVRSLRALTRIEKADRSRGYF